MKQGDVILTPVPLSRIMGIIGSISSERHNRLLKTLSDYLIRNSVI